MSQVRLQKYLAEAGLGSRRAAETLILAGRVTVNGRLIRQLGTKVQPLQDAVAVDGIPVHPRKRIYIALHKPPGYLCSRSQPGRNRLVGQLLPKDWSHLFTIGRLDAPSEGLLLLTNDGEFAQQVAHPRYGVEKCYFVEVKGYVTKALIPKLLEGVICRGERLRAVQARILHAHQTRTSLELVLREGKNREIRRLMSAFGLRVLRLVRFQIGPVRLGELPAGRWRTLTESEIKSLLPSL